MPQSNDESIRAELGIAILRIMTLGFPIRLGTLSLFLVVNATSPLLSKSAAVIKWPKEREKNSSTAVNVSFLGFEWSTHFLEVCIGWTIERKYDPRLERTAIDYITTVSSLPCTLV